MKEHFNAGVEDYKKGVCRIPCHLTFFQLATEEERWYWHGWIFAKDSDMEIKG